VEKKKELGKGSEPRSNTVQFLRFRVVGTAARGLSKEREEKLEPAIPASVAVWKNKIVFAQGYTAGGRATGGGSA